MNASVRDVSVYACCVCMHFVYACYVCTCMCILIVCILIYGTNIHRKHYVNMSVRNVIVCACFVCMRVMYVRARVYLWFASCMEQTHTEGSLYLPYLLVF